MLLRPRYGCKVDEFRALQKNVQRMDDPHEKAAPLIDQNNSGRRAADASDEDPQGPGTARGPRDAPADTEPLTASGLGKLFAVPLFIIAAIVGSAIVVVLLFGAPASSSAQSLASLLSALEASAGRNVAGGMLMPREKEHWQAGLELTARLAETPTKFTEAELEMIVTRVSNLVRSEIAELNGDTQTRRQAAAWTPRAGQTRLEFLIRAVGLTGRPAAVDTLVAVVVDGREPFTTVAMEQLGNLAHLPKTSGAVGPIVDLMARSTVPETKLVGCTVLSILADPSDERVLDALNAVRLSADAGEIAWSAALALARLGSDRGKTTLMDLLDRSFWESADRYATHDGNGAVLRYKMPPARVDQALVAAVDAAANLNDRDVWDLISKLQTDASASVRTKAIEAVSRRN